MSTVIRLDKVKDVDVRVIHEGGVYRARSMDGLILAKGENLAALNAAIAKANSTTDPLPSTKAANLEHFKVRIERALDDARYIHTAIASGIGLNDAVTAALANLFVARDYLNKIVDEN